METGKTLGFRPTPQMLNDIILECDKKGISKSELLERKVVIANNILRSKKILLEMLDQIDFSNAELNIYNQICLNKIKKFVKNEL